APFSGTISCQSADDRFVIGQAQFQQGQLTGTYSSPSLDGYSYSKKRGWMWCLLHCGVDVMKRYPPYVQFGWIWKCIVCVATEGAEMESCIVCAVGSITFMVEMAPCVLHCIQSEEPW